MRPAIHLPPMKTPSRQHGAAALIVTLLLFFVLMLSTVFVNRNLVFEHRSSANQYRATQAFEAAEAGLEWALAELNTHARLGADCKPANGPTATVFRDRYLVYRRSDASFLPLTWLNAGVATPLQPACVRGAEGWACSCPTDGLPVLTEPAAGAPAPAFSVQFLAGPRPGTVRVVAIGCSRLAAPCLAGTTATADASARIEVALGLLPGLRTPPVATLTARGAVNAGSASLGVHNADPATGVAVDAGGAISASALRLTSPAGASVAVSTAANDAPLANLAPDRLFAAHFGIDRNGWKSQPAVERVTCSDDCGADLTAAIGDDLAHRMIWVDGDLRLTGPITLGSPQRPLIIVASGALRLSGGVVIHGLLYGRSLSWNTTAANSALLRGAAIIEGDYSGDAAADMVYDTEVLAALRGNSGSFARIDGSWRDF
jgi:Tfp pilus assembly protein PilX